MDSYGWTLCTLFAAAIVLHVLVRQQSSHETAVSNELAPASSLTPLLFFVLGFIAGLSGEALLFLQSQSRGAERFLLKDFRAVAFLKPGLAAGRERVVSEKLRAIPGVEEARFVSKEAALDSLKEEEPDLVDSVALLGENPLPDSFEIRLTLEALSRMSHLIEEAYALGDFSDIRYKSGQARAILQAQYYGRFLDLLLSSVLCLCGVLAAVWIWPSALGGLRGTLGRRALLRACWSGGGALCGLGVCAMLLVPLRGLAYALSGPSLAGQAVLVIGIAALTGLCARS